MSTDTPGKRYNGGGSGVGTVGQSHVVEGDQDAKAAQETNSGVSRRPWRDQQDKSGSQGGASRTGIQNRRIHRCIKLGRAGRTEDRTDEVDDHFRWADNYHSDADGGDALFKGAEDQHSSTDGVSLT